MTTTMTLSYDQVISRAARFARVEYRIALDRYGQLPPTLRKLIARAQARSRMVGFLNGVGWTTESQMVREQILRRLERLNQARPRRPKFGLEFDLLMIQAEKKRLSPANLATVVMLERMNEAKDHLEGGVESQLSYLLCKLGYEKTKALLGSGER